MGIKPQLCVVCRLLQIASLARSPSLGKGKMGQVQEGMEKEDDDGSVSRGDSNGGEDELLWCRDLGFHDQGHFSMAVIQANSTMEDQSLLVSGLLSSTTSGPRGTFVGVYDGHGGAEAAQFVNDNLICNLRRFASTHQEVSEDVIRKAFAATEAAFLSLVRKTWLTTPRIASSGTCCLVGVISNGYVHVANLGDSRVVLGRAVKGSKQVKAIQLSTEHNACFESVRNELRSAHPQDPHIVQLKYNVWRVKGLIQVSRSIGDAYLKKAEFNREPLLPKFRLKEAFEKPILSAEPSITAHRIREEDQFLIFASDGLWEYLNNQRAAEIVYSYPRDGIARRLIKAALEEAAKKREMRCSDLKWIDRGVRRHFHDDITVVVVFLDAHSLHGKFLDSSSYSIRGGEGLSLLRQSHEPDEKHP